MGEHLLQRQPRHLRRGCHRQRAEPGAMVRYVAAVRARRGEPASRVPGARLSARLQRRPRRWSESVERQHPATDPPRSAGPPRAPGRRHEPAEPFADESARYVAHVHQLRAHHQSDGIAESLLSGSGKIALLSVTNRVARRPTQFLNWARGLFRDIRGCRR